MSGNQLTSIPVEVIAILQMAYKSAMSFEVRCDLSESVREHYQKLASLLEFACLQCGCGKQDVYGVYLQNILPRFAVDPESTTMLFNMLWQTLLKFPADITAEPYMENIMKFVYMVVTFVTFHDDITVEMIRDQQDAITHLLSEPEAVETETP